MKYRYCTKERSRTAQAGPGPGSQKDGDMNSEALRVMQVQGSAPGEGGIHTLFTPTECRAATQERLEFTQCSHPIVCRAAPPGRLESTQCSHNSNSLSCCCRSRSGGGFHPPAFARAACAPCRARCSADLGSLQPGTSAEEHVHRGESTRWSPPDASSAGITLRVGMWPLCATCVKGAPLL